MNEIRNKKSVLRLGPLLRKYVVNTSWLMLGKFFQMAMGLVVGVVIARYLGPERYGALSYAVAFVGLFVPLATLGMESIVVRDMAGNPEPECHHELLGTAAVLRLFGTLLMSSCAVVTAVVMSVESLERTLIVIVMSSYFFQILTIIEWYFRAMVISRYLFMAQLYQILISSLVKVTLVLWHAPLMAFAIAIVFDSFLLGVFLVFFYSRKERRLLKWRFNIHLASELLAQSWPLVLSGAAIIIQARIDQVMLGSMLGREEVGLYSVALRMIEAFSFLAVVICNSIAPEVTVRRRRKDGSYYRLMKNLYRLMFLVFVAVSLPLFLYGTKLVVFMFGEDYRGAGVLLALLSVRLLFTNFGVARFLFITNEGLFKYSFIAAVIGAAINIMVNYALIPVWGASGAIIATIISFAVTTFVLDSLYPPARNNFMIMVSGLLTPWKLTLRDV